MTDLGGVRSVLFDVDDTLFDRRAAQIELLRAVREVLPSLFDRTDPARLLKAFLDSDRQLANRLDRGESLEEPRLERWKAFLSLLDLDPRAAQRVNRVYLQRYTEVNPAIPGAAETLRRLRARYTMGIVSNGYRDIQRRKLEALGLLGHFSCVVLSDEIGIRKPDRRIFAEGVHRLGRTAPECLFVGDSLAYDVRGARQAGLRTCWFNPDREELPPGAPPPDLIIPSLPDLVSALGA